MEEPEFVMKLAYIIGNSFKSLFSYPLFSVTMSIGIIISTASILTIISVGSSAKQTLLNIFRSSGFGENTIIVVSGSKTRKFRAKHLTITRNDINDLKSIYGVKDVSPGQIGGIVAITGGGHLVMSPLHGVTKNWADVREWPITGGRFIDDHDISSNAKVAVIGNTVAQSIFGTSNVIGRWLRISGIFTKVIGLFGKKGSISGFDMDKIVVVPYSFTANRLLHTRFFSYAKVDLYKSADKKAVENSINIMMRENHHLRRGRLNDFRIITPDNIIKIITSAQTTLTIILAIIAAISFVTSGVVVINMMTANVAERRYEIAIKRAIGATNKDIKYEFLAFGASVSLFSSIVGVIVGIFITLFATHMAKIGFFIDPLTVAAVIIFACLLGMISTIIPANDAAKTDPVEILK